MSKIAHVYVWRARSMRDILLLNSCVAMPGATAEKLTLDTLRCGQVGAHVLATGSGGETPSELFGVALYRDDSQQVKLLSLVIQQRKASLISSIWLQG